MDTSHKKNAEKSVSIYDIANDETSQFSLNFSFHEKEYSFNTKLIRFPDSYQIFFSPIILQNKILNFAHLEDGTYLGKAESAAILDRYPQVEYLTGGYHNWEFTRAGVNKGTGIRFLAERIGVPMEFTMACGDSENDLSMLKAVQVAVAMENASDAIKK